MGIPAILMLAVALGVDAFSMAVGIGMRGIRLRNIIMVSLVIGLFHILMPLIGIYLGQQVGKFAGDLARLIGSGVLIFIGGFWLWEIIRATRLMEKYFGAVPVPDNMKAYDYTGTAGLMLLAFGVSLDALTVGFGLGLFKFNLALIVGTIGIMAAFMTFMGFILGRRVGVMFGERAKLAAAFIIIAVGINIYYW